MEVRFGQYDGLQVEGTLKAVGTASLPIVFTGTSATPGWWDGIAITGTAAAPNVGSVLDHVVIEYGGYNFANLRLTYASMPLRNSIVRYSGKDGVYGSTQGVSDIVATAFTGNKGYVVRFFDGSVNPVLSGLTVAENGYDGVAMGSGTIQGTHVWEAAGAPYYVIGELAVATGSTLTVEPGVEVRFGQYDGLQVEGTLKAVGTASLPIVFTGTSATPGWWDGIAITGTAVAPNVGSVLDHVVIEYGGYNFANLRLLMPACRCGTASFVIAAKMELRQHAGCLRHRGHRIHRKQGLRSPVLRWFGEPSVIRADGCRERI